MSQHDGTDDPYRTPGTADGRPGPGAPHGQQPQPGMPYGQQPYPGMPYPDQPSGGVPDRSSRPPAVVRLVQVMLAGAVMALLQGVYAVFAVEDVLGASGADLDQVARDSGMDPARVADVMGGVFVGVVVVMTVLTVGLWLLFARLFDRGTGRVVGTVLGGINGALLLFGLLQPDGLLGWVLTAVEAAVVVTALVLLWRPATSAWFDAVAAQRARSSWG